MFMEHPSMRPKGSAKVLEARRRRALALLGQGLSLNEVGRKLGCAPSSVMRWQRRVRRHGAAGVTVRSSPGRPPKLRPGERRRLVRQLLKGALAHGYRTDLWTTARIAQVIKLGFRVQYHPDHVGRLMHSLGWSHQKPESRAVERNDEEIARWKREEWPRVKKTPRGWGPTSSSSTNPAFC
jgi:transposase